MTGPNVNGPGWNPIDKVLVYYNQLTHPGLAEIPAPNGSQEVVVIVDWSISACVQDCLKVYTTA